VLRYQPVVEARRGDAAGARQQAVARIGHRRRAHRQTAGVKVQQYAADLAGIQHAQFRSADPLSGSRLPATACAASGGAGSCSGIDSGLDARGAGWESPTPQFRSGLPVRA
jgi:hypothetical protein